MPPGDVRGRFLLAGAAAAIAAVVACAPAPSPGATALASPPPATAATLATASSVPGVDPASTELHLLDSRYLPAESPVSANGEVLWTAGEKSPSEIWRYVPGTAEPERIYATPLEDGHIHAITASSAGYAFVEQSVKAYGKGGWRLWFLSVPGQQPIQVDRGTAPGSGAVPTIAMDGHRIAWAAFDEPRTGPVSRLRIASLGDLQPLTTLIEAPIADRLLWYPALSGDELWYATIKADFDATGVGDEFHIEQIDLANPEVRPFRFPGIGNDFNPAVNDGYIVWKTNVPGDSALNWGTLHVLDRESEAVASIPVDRANHPSIGDRYIAFEEITHGRLVAYDPVTSTMLDLGAAWTRGTAGSVFYGGQSLSGRLLAFSVQSADTAGLPRIGWAVLPE